MTTENINGIRGAQIIHLLSEHGSMSVRGLSAVLAPKIHPRRLRRALKRLGDSGMVEKRYDSMFRGAGVFYELSEEFRTPHATRRLELLHSETCAVWTERFKHMFPNALVLRDHQFGGRKDVERALIGGAGEHEILPDILILLPNKQGRHPTAVGIEIEQNHKSQSRLVQKLKKYARGSNLDGVVYLCPKGSIGRRVMTIFESRILARAHQIKHYGNHFLLFSEGISGDYEDAFDIQNVNGDVVSLSNWMRVLNQVPRESRRDSDFTQGASSGPPSWRLRKI